MLLGSVVFVLLIACANVANLQFARATGAAARSGGANRAGRVRWRVIIQLVTESVLLSLAGAGLGTAGGEVGHEHDQGRDAAGDRALHSRLEEISAWTAARCCFTLPGGGAERRAGRPGAGLAVLAAQSDRRAEGRRARRLLTGKAPASPAQYSGGGGGGAGGGSAGGRGPDGPRLSAHWWTTGESSTRQPC